ncbi:hypothetical protein ZWY2020_018260 [Hordeum vulgare]|nr:hypothetical protein ZWY2020_018260 [Hordeum vulgare]
MPLSSLAPCPCGHYEGDPPYSPYLGYVLDMSPGWGRSAALGACFANAPCSSAAVEDGGGDPVTGQIICTTIGGKIGNPKRVSCLCGLIKTPPVWLSARTSRPLASALTRRNRSCYVSFTLAAPNGVSYLNLHCPVGEGSDDACSLVRATDKDLVLFDIYDSSRIPYPGAPPDLLVYTAAGPSPSVQQLPLFPKGGRASWRFMRGKFTTGILRLSKKRYVVADLSELDAAICVFNSSQTKQWKIISITPGLVCWSQSQSSGQLPDPWSTDDVLAFDGRFLCWVDYFRGVLLSDFSSTSVVLHYVPFPGEKEYPEDVAKRFPGRFRNVSITQGKMCFVHIDNDFHETFEDDCPCPCRQLPERIISQPQQHLGPQKNHHLDSQLQQLQVQVGATWCDQP